MALPVPPGLDPQHAVLARLMGVTMTTLATTEARPGEIVVVCGLGPVGFLAALSFRRAGYKVVGVDPFAVRRDYAAAAGLTEIYDHVPLEASHIAGKVGLVLECSGHEQAALDGCNIIRRLGEIVQVATPWTKMTDISAHTLLHTIFHKYAVVRSGWEWEIPVTPSVFSPVCIQDNLRTALGWIADGSVNVGNTISMHKPADAAQAYSDLSDKKLPGLFVEFDWR